MSSSIQLISPRLSNFNLRENVIQKQTSNLTHLSNKSPINEQREEAFEDFYFLWHSRTSYRSKCLRMITIISGFKLNGYIETGNFFSADLSTKLLVILYRIIQF